MTGHRAVGKATTCGYPSHAEYVPKRVSREDIPAGQGRMVPHPPEPLLLQSVGDGDTSSEPPARPAGTGDETGKRLSVKSAAWPGWIRACSTRSGGGANEYGGDDSVTLPSRSPPIGLVAGLAGFPGVTVSGLRRAAQAGPQISSWRRTWPVFRSASAPAAWASGRRAETIDSRSRSPFMTRSTMSGMSRWGVMEP